MMKKAIISVATAAVALTIAAPAFASGEPTVAYGSTGTYVTKAQTELTNAGYTTLGIDGSFGPNTETATKRFQQGAGLVQDGSIGPLTWAALDAALTINGDIAKAISLTGTSTSWQSGMQTLVQKESGGKPYAYNSTAVWYSSTWGYQHAEGLCQLMPPTFQAYEMSGHTNIWNPIDNVIASIKYIKARYGSVYNIPGISSGTYSGYAVPGGDTQLGNDAWVTDQTMPVKAKKGTK